MFSADYQSRIDIQQICSFFKFGTERGYLEDGSLEDRHSKYSRAIDEGLISFRDRVLAVDWDTISGDILNRKIEEIFKEVFDAIEDLSELAYEMGFRAGLSIGHQLFKET